MFAIKHLISCIAEPLLFKQPIAAAHVKGSAEFPDILGEVLFYKTDEGTLVLAALSGLPLPEGNCTGGVLGFHIHEGARCAGNAEDPFADAKAHWNPTNCPHPYHAGDMPPLFSNSGRACMAFVTDRFSAEDVIHKTVIVHDHPDDFMTQPSGNSGKKIACGVIQAYGTSYPSM